MGSQSPNNPQQPSTQTTKDFHQQRLKQGQQVGLINLGCARNLVDSQTLLTNMKRKGHRIVDVENAEVAVVNTCSFIESAKQESIDTIVDLVELKKQGKIKKVIVAGCLAQRYPHELAKEFKEVDAIIGAQKLSSTDIPSQLSLTPKHYAYVKISESCYNRCSFCIIPKLKGKFVSRKFESVVEEIVQKEKESVKEINLIGQDITAYGMDLYKQLSLAKLLKEIVPQCKDSIEWIRLLYAFPAHVTDELIKVMASEPKICKYIDIPLQHISDHLLKSMNRNITTAGTRQLLDKIKKAMPTGSIRTTFIVGMPGETDQDFQELMDFVQEYRFHRVGTFVYSHEEGTEAYEMPNQVPDEVKRERMEQLMTLQREISLDLQSQYVGQTLKVMIDEKSQEDAHVYIGRTEYDAVEVDGIVYVESDRELKSGEMVEVNINDAYEYDLAGKALNV